MSSPEFTRFRFSTAPRSGIEDVVETYINDAHTRTSGHVFEEEIATLKTIVAFMAKHLPPEAQVELATEICHYYEVKE